MTDIPDAAVEALLGAFAEKCRPGDIGLETLAQRMLTAALPHLELGINDIALDALALVAERDAEITRLKKSQLDLFEAALLLLHIYKPHNLNESDSRPWQQLSDACLRSGLKP